MSHSEIAGSKPAHSSPTLIAACHVLHRLYMPRHSPDALTSRLRVHTTNDSTGKQLCISFLQCGDLTQPDNHLCTTLLSFLVRRPQNRTASPRHRLKNPFTMSKRDATRPIFAGKPAKPLSSSLEYGEPLFGAPTKPSASQGRPAAAAAYAAKA